MRDSNRYQFFWNPDDFAVAGTTATRSFALAADAARPIDGLEIFGRVTVVPEPGTFLLLGIGLAAILGWRPRRVR